MLYWFRSFSTTTEGKADRVHGPCRFICSDTYHDRQVSKKGFRVAAHCVIGTGIIYFIYGIGSEASPSLKTGKQNWCMDLADSYVLICTMAGKYSERDPSS